MQSRGWIDCKDSKEEMENNFLLSMANVLTILEKSDIKINTVPSLGLFTLEELYRYREIGFIPAIAERRDNQIVFYYEILHDIINEINNETQIERFIQSVCLHEMLHILLKHKTDTEENRQIAEEEVNAWMTINAWQFENVFLQYMPLADRICEKHKNQ